MVYFVTGRKVTQGGRMMTKIKLAEKPACLLWSSGNVLANGCHN